MPLKVNRFPRNARLLKHAEFDQVYKHGRRHFSATMTFFYQVHSGRPGAARIGFTVSRALGGSVERNRMRRRMREAVRRHLSELIRALQERELAAEIVVNPKKALLNADPDLIQADIVKAFRTIGAAK